VYLVGAVGGEGEPANRRITFSIDVTALRDDNKEYSDAELTLSLELKGFDQNFSDYFMALENNKVILVQD
jgi:hypothetical protein